MWVEISQQIINLQTESNYIINLRVIPFLVIETLRCGWTVGWVVDGWVDVCVWVGDPCMHSSGFIPF